MKVKVLKEGLTLNGKPLKKGEVYEVPDPIAVAWKERGLVEEPGEEKPRKKK